LRVPCRPGATPLERLEALVAYHICSNPEIPQQLADLLIWATDCGPTREQAVRGAFPQSGIPDPAEALGMVRALLLLSGVATDRVERLSGRPGEDFARMMEGRFHPLDLASPDVYVAPVLVDGYCHMGAGFARGMDRVFGAVTGQPLSEHFRRALAMLEPGVSSRVSGGS
jgi:hypothetical protein